MAKVKIKIRPEKLDNQEEFLEGVMKWRGKTHRYENPLPFKNSEGRLVQMMFCNKCGLSEGFDIHRGPYGKEFNKNKK